MNVDADFAARETMLRLTSGVAELENRRSSLGPARKVCEHCPQGSLSSTQSQRGQRTACTVRLFLKAFGVAVEAVFFSDAIASRQGCGRLKHLEVKWLWVQEKVSEQALRLRKHPTETNITDLATKYLLKHRMEVLLTASNLVLSRKGKE